MTAPSLTTYAAPAEPRGVVLMLHGGKQHSTLRVDWRSTSWHRSRAMQRAIGPRLRDAGLVTTLLRYLVRGWNDVDSPSPIPDARWALDEVRRQHGELPVVLLGHSMGARTAVHVADDAAVIGVVALAPWLTEDDAVEPLAGKRLAVAHGSNDRITSARASATFCRRAAEVAASVEMRDMGGVGHYMFKRVADWNDFAADRAAQMHSEEISVDRE